MVFQNKKFDKLPYEILIKILLFNGVNNINIFEELLSNYNQFENYVYDIILNTAIIKNGEYNLSIQFNENYTLSFPNTNLQNIKRYISDIFKNKNYKNLLNIWYSKKLKF
tara:strand:- start:673 stop:1002 length:330 start_codon:yes stop_codon:yes gene_type:complete